MSDILDELLKSPESPLPSTYQYWKGIKEKRRIILNGQVDENIIESVFIPLMDWDNDGSGEPIEIILCTPGGSILDGMPLCDLIDNLKTPTTIRVISYAYSMGSYLLMAGFNNPNVRKVAYPFSTALIHGGSLNLEGALDSVKDTMKFQNKLDTKIKEYVLTHSNITEKEYKKLDRTEAWLTAEDMLKYGLIDEIIGKNHDSFL